MNEQKLLVCGAGAMGRQIALLGAIGGVPTTLYDLSEGQLAAANEEIEKLLARQVQKERLTEAETHAVRTRLDFLTDLDSATDGATFVIEAIVERLDIKRELFSSISERVGAETVLATNSSSIVSSELASAIEHPERLCNMHFFNPPMVMKLVEIVRGPHTGEPAVERAHNLAVTMNRSPVVLQKEVFGFVVNRVLNAIFDEAIWLYEQGVASIEDIDEAVTKGLNHPIGPFALLDLTGIDVNYHIRELKAQTTGDPNDGPSRSLTELFEAGHLGRKTGRGFYDYRDGGRA